MEIKFNPYGRKSSSMEYGVHFNLMYFYVEKNGAHPDIYELDTPVSPDTFPELEKIGAKRIFIAKIESENEGSFAVGDMEVCHEMEDVMVLCYRRESIVSRLERYDIQYEEEDGERRDEVEFRCKILYRNAENLEKVKACLRRVSQSKKKGNVHLLCSIDGMLSLQRFDIKLPGKVDLDLNYGLAAKEKFSKMEEYLENGRSGLILLSGEPGTGKSTFIKHLTTITDRKIIYMPPTGADQLTSPDFISFIMGHRGSVLLLEDAEKALRSRDSQDNGAISNLLNITDGILGDCLNITVIATFNIDREKIDSALVRKGRLLVEHHFKALSSDDANRLLESVGSSRRTDSPMTLAEIYNDEDNFHEKEGEKRKVGF